MPTHNRRFFVPRAINYFLQQDYANKELIIVDDGTDPIEDLIPDESIIRYISLDHRISIGKARNIACKEAKGDIILHWDDDDWIADWRVKYQVDNLLLQRADICGLNKIIFYEIAPGRSWQYIYPEGERPWVSGNTLCYTKAFWSVNPFPEINVGEDVRFLWSERQKKIAALPDFTFYVALIHPGNSSPKHIMEKRWHPFAAEKVRDIIGKDWFFYGNLIDDKKKEER